MAKKTKAPHANIVEENLLSFTKNAMTSYGKYTLENRAIPDFRDGLKPVHRRILWAANELGMQASKGLLKKSARLVGDVLGKYHPHGDSAVYQAAVSLVQSKQPTLFGSGNWGTIIDGAAAQRYTECRLAQYSDDVFFDKRYLPVTETVGNFDNTTQEPVILPALVPNLLLNGAFGIATGGRVAIPAFEPEGVIKLTQKAIKGKAVTVKDCTKFLVPTCAEGGLPYLEDEYGDTLKEFYETGVGSVWWIPDADYDLDSRSILVKGFAPKVVSGLETVLKKVAQLDYVSSVEDMSIIDEQSGHSKLQYEITLKNSIPKAEVEDYLDEIYGMFEASQSLVFATTTRVKVDNETDVSFEIMSMPQFFQKWAAYRIELERRAIKYQMGVVEQRLARAELLLLAVLNRDIIIKALDREDTEKYLMKQLKLTEEQVNAILELKVKQLKKLEESNIKTQIKEYKAQIKEYKAIHKDPTDHIVKALGDWL